MHVKIGRNDPCWCGSMKKYKNCHQSFDEKIEELRSQGHIVPDHSLIKTPEQIAGIKESAKINIAVLDEVASKIKEGMTTEEIDKIVYDTTTKMGGIPAPLNYEGFPKSVCTSINEEVCHGIPSPKVVLKDGDIITITTKTGNKTVTLEREGVTTNIINRLVSGSTWLTLKQGENKFYVRASEGLSSLKVRLIHRNAYLGV